MEFNILLLTHGAAGAALIASSEMIIGKEKNVDAISLDSGVAPETFIEKVKAYLEKNDNETLIFCDLFGGTPANVASLFSQKDTIRCISGLNLAMLMEAIMQRQYAQIDDFKEFAKGIEEIGKEACKVFGMPKEK